MNTEYLSIAIAVVSLLWIASFEVRLRKFMKGKNGGTLESVIHQIVDEVEAIHSKNAEHLSHIKQLDGRLKRAVQGISTVRFNPFRDMGSKQSFATALLNEQGDGVVISTLYSRDRTSVFAKPIKAFGSEYELTPEEDQALKEAKVAN